MQKPWNEVHLKTNTVFFQLCARGAITGITSNFQSLSATDPIQLYGKHAFRLLNPEFVNAWKDELVSHPGREYPQEFFTEVNFNGSAGFPMLINLNDEGSEGFSGSATFLKKNYQSSSFFRQQEILRSTLQSIDDLVFVADQHGRFTECYPGNEEATLFFSSDLFVGKTFHEVGFPPEVSQKFIRAVQRAREDGKTQQVQYALEVFGSQFFYQARISPRYGNQGQFEGVTAICRDITSLKKIEKQLIESRDFYLTILQKFPSLVWRSGKNGHFDFFNQPWLDFTGKSSEELLGFGWTRCIHPEERNQVVESFLRALRQQKIYRQEYRLLHHSGKYRWVMDVGQPVYSLKNEFVGFIGSCNDIQEERTNRRLLEESEERYRNIVELHSDLVARWRPDGTLSFVNKPLCKTFRRLSSELLGQEFIELFSQDQRQVLELNYQQMIASPKIKVLEVNFMDPEGRCYWIQWISSPIFDSSGKVVEFQSVGRDITTRKHEEKEKEKLLNNLNRRVLELVFLNEFSSLIHQPSISLPQVLHHLVGNLPGVFEKTAKSFVRILFRDQEFVSSNFTTNYCLKKRFGRWGVLELCYEFNPLQNEDRKVLVDEMHSYLTIICDVMETFVNQHEAEHQLESTRQKYLELFESITDIVFIMDGKGRFTSLNPAMQNILGYNLDQEIMYKNIIVPSGLQEVQRIFREAIIHQQSNVTFEADILNSQGAIKNFLINCLIKYQSSKPFEILGVARDVTESRQVSRRMIKAIVDTEERERKRFAEELHDGLGPLLSAIKMYLQKADASGHLNDHDRQIIGLGSDLTNEAIVQTRMIANNLTPSILADFGVLRALRNFAAKINQLGKIRVNLQSKQQDLDLQPAESLVVYRVLTELINNALKHSQADTINVDFHWKKNILMIDYFENGDTIHPVRIIKNPENKGMGLKNIINRIESINGIIEFNKGNKQGFQVKILFASGSKC